MWSPLTCESFEPIEFQIFFLYLPIGSLWLETSATALRGPYVILEAHRGHMLSRLTLDVSKYFNEHQADYKMTDEHSMNFGDRYWVKTRWNFQAWWKPAEISRPGENLEKCSKPCELSKLGENLVNFQNLVKTWWFLCGEHEEVFYRFQIRQIQCFEPTFWWTLCVFMVKMDPKCHWTKTWWNPVKTWWKLFENLMQQGENKMKPTNPNADMNVDKQRQYLFVAFPANSLVRQPEFTHWGDTLVRHSHLTFL